jgi:hypothetical protein
LFDLLISILFLFAHIDIFIRGLKMFIYNTILLREVTDQ